MNARTMLRAPLLVLGVLVLAGLALFALGSAGSLGCSRSAEPAAPLATPAPAASAAQSGAVSPAGKAGPNDVVRRLEFAPKPGTKSAKTLHVEHKLVLQSLTFVSNGVQQSSQQQIDFASRITLRTHDEYRSTEGGRPMLLARTFDEYQLHADFAFTEPGGEKRLEKADAAGPLASAVVLYTWVPSEKTYGRCYEAHETSEEFLAHLGEDFDLRAFLPQKPVKPGDRWDVELGALADLLAPCGDMPLRFSTSGDGFSYRTLSQGIGGPLEPVLSGPLEGSIVARLRSIGRASPDGSAPPSANEAEVAIIELEIKASVHRDQTALAERLLLPVERYDGTQVRKSALDWKFEGHGTITWDLATGTCRAAECSGSEDVSSDAAIEVATPKSSSHTSIHLAGGLKLDYAAKTTTPK